MRTTVNKGRVSYAPASLDGHKVEEVGPKPGFVSFTERVEGTKVRERSPSFEDHYGQARLFWNSMTPPEKEHIAKALQFELSKVETKEVRMRMLGHLVQINEVLAAQVSKVIGEEVPTSHETANPKGTGDVPEQSATLADATTPTSSSGGILKTKGLSMEEDQPKLAKGRKVAILVAEGVAIGEVEGMKAALAGEAASCEVVGPHLGPINGEGGFICAGKTFANSSSVLFDAVYVPGGKASVEMLETLPDAQRFIDEAYKHGKPIAASSEGVELVASSQLGDLLPDSEAATQGVLLAKEGIQALTAPFLQAIASHRFHNRQTDKVSA
jgi:catalase